METIKHNNTILAMILRRDFPQQNKEGITFFTPDDQSQQLAYMRYPAGHKIIPHLHKPVERRITDTMETILIKSGVVDLDLFWDENTRVGTYRLQAGDIVMLGAGGHGFRVVEPAELFEIKQGPYMGMDADKRKFYPEGYQ